MNAACFRYAKFRHFALPHIFSIWENKFHIEKLTAQPIDFKQKNKYLL